MAKHSRVYSLSDQEFKDLISKSHTCSECLKALGLSTNGGSSSDIIKQRIKKLGCSTLHFSIKSEHYSRIRYSLSDILVKNSKYTNTRSLKQRLLKAGLLEYKCSKCGINTYNDEPISLQLEHINGDNTDNRLENITLLCPNCHSQTKTYTGRNIKINNRKESNCCKHCGSKIDSRSKYCIKCYGKAKQANNYWYNKDNILCNKYIDKDSLLIKIKSQSFCEIAKEFGVSDNAVRKWCKIFGLPFRKKRH